ncbi:MAG: hypothetical protein WCT77_14630 [Bacteroidota bacterium]
MGTWALPQTKKQAETLKQLMTKPLPAKEAVEKLYNLLGDDCLFDEISNLREEEGDSYDLRSTVKCYIEKILTFYQQTPENFAKPFEDEALAVLKAI